jgi:hypothetical protein
MILDIYRVDFPLLLLLKVFQDPMFLLSKAHSLKVHILYPIKLNLWPLIDPALTEIC